MKTTLGTTKLVGPRILIGRMAHSGLSLRQDCIQRVTDGPTVTVKQCLTLTKVNEAEAYRKLQRGAMEEIRRRRESSAGVTLRAWMAITKVWFSKFSYLTLYLWNYKRKVSIFSRSTTLPSVQDKRHSLKLSNWKARKWNKIAFIVTSQCTAYSDIFRVCSIELQWLIFIRWIALRIQ